MGLDMYLLKGKKEVANDNWEVLEEVGYLRKANQIHAWMVDNVQDGEDDCGYYEVSREKVEELHEVCAKIIGASKLIRSSMIVNGRTLENRKWKPNYVDGYTIANPEVAQKSLPTQGGFFFGSTEYDQYYYVDVLHTLKFLTDILMDTNFETEKIIYTSSW